MESASLEGNDENTVPPQVGEEGATALKLSLPLSKVKKIGKLTAPECNISTEAAQLLALGAEHYVQLLGKAAHKFSQLENRKTVKLKDIDKCIERDWLFSILEDAIEDWPESQGGSLRSAPTSNRTLSSTKKGRNMDAHDSAVQLSEEEEGDAETGGDEANEVDDDDRDDEEPVDESAEAGDGVGEEEEEEEIELTDGYMDVEENVDEKDVRSRTPSVSPHSGGVEATNDERSPDTRKVRDIEDF